MDNFIDKLAQRFSAQEMIKANAQAETEEMRRLELQVSEYEKILQEMRKLHYKNSEISERLDQMVEDSAGTLQGVKAEEQRLVGALRGLMEEQARNSRAELERQGEQQAFIAALKELADGYRKDHEQALEEKRKALDLIGPIQELSAEQARNREAESMRKGQQEDLIAALKDLIGGYAQERQAQQELLAGLRGLMEEQEKCFGEQQGAVTDLKALLEEQGSAHKKELESAQEKLREQQSDIAKITSLIDEKFLRSEDFVHKENVKVYRNVQAVMVDELKRYAEASQADQDKMSTKLNAKLNKVMTCSVLSLLASAAAIALLVLNMMGIL